MTASAANAAAAARYDEAIGAAVDEHERGYFQEAREHFRAAHEIYPNARTLRGLGKVEFELRNYGEAVHFLTDALAATERPLTPELRTEVEHILERARAYVGEVHVDVQPGSASVSVDGVPVASGPRAALTLQVGDHLLEFRADGRTPERRFVRVRGHEQINIQVVLAAPEHERSAALATGERSEHEPLRYKPWVWAAAGAALVATAVGIGIGVRNHRSEGGEVSGGTTGFVLGSQ